MKTQRIIFSYILLICLTLFSSTEAIEHEIIRNNIRFSSDLAQNVLNNIKASDPDVEPEIKDYFFDDFSIKVFVWQGTRAVVVVCDETGAIRYRKFIDFLFPDSTTFIVEKFKKGIIVAYHGHGSRGSSTKAWQWVELLHIDYISKDKESSLITIGKNENGGWGNPDMIDFNSFAGQYPTISVNPGFIDIQYLFRKWENTGRYSDRDFLTEESPEIETRKNMIIQLNAASDFIISSDSTTATCILSDELQVDEIIGYEKFPKVETYQY